MLHIVSTGRRKVSSPLAICQASICSSFSMLSFGACVLNYIWLIQILHRMMSAQNAHSEARSADCTKFSKIRLLRMQQLHASCKLWVRLLESSEVCHGGTVGHIPQRFSDLKRIHHLAAILAKS